MRECEHTREISGKWIERKHCSKRQNDKREREKQISRAEMKERERGNRGGRERWPLHRSPLSGNRHHYASGLVLEPQWTCDCKAWPVCYTVRGPLSGCFRTSCTDTGPNTSSHTHTPPSTSTAGCTDRLHEYLAEQVIMSTHIRLAFFPPFHIHTYHKFGSDSTIQLISLLISMRRSDPALWPGHFPRAARARLLKMLPRTEKCL